ncbi:nitroreductase [Desulfotomaculum nigrificans CO-1-SRB]|uniref:Nitroreductase n=1 Tax=Desulfotomaculum nigrificans (strain DSM 14880 / VKM B-2319 / CO-1-SRB) TaxID=868595 RepID=F6B6A1_DESCC|nr:nitroreductase family protein [Desulfotomaculum nigrificans]AEF95524.1 nitroreductase [Desulfotomaculum nigrificans CO-1-SRB]
MLKEISEWKSVRKFTSEPVTKDKLLSIMQAGRRAPSWKNIQPWKFIAITEEKDRAKLAEVFTMGVLIKKAPAVILCVGTLQSWVKAHQLERLKELMGAAGIAMTDEEIEKRYLNHELAQSLSIKPASIMSRTFENMGIAYGFMILEAMHLGLGACIVGEVDNELVAVNDQKYAEIKSYFNLSETEVITAAIIVGYPAKELPLTPRKPESEIIFFKE